MPKTQVKSEETKFVVEGDLMLSCQEGGFADDAFVLLDMQPAKGSLAELVNTVTNLHLGSASLANLVAAYFHAERMSPTGNRYIGPVRITIEKLPEAEVEVA